MVAQAQFSTAAVTVQPGDAESVALTLFNLGNHTETYTLVPSGLLAGWVRLEPPTITLFGGTGQDIQVTVRPPLLATTPAGPAPLTIRIIPLEDPDDVIIAETTVTIGAFHERQVRMLQPVERSRRRATFELLVENGGNTQANCRLHLIDTTQRLDGDFDPAAVGIEPGGNSLVRLRMKAIRRQWRSGSRTIPFSIEADQQGFPTAAAGATFVQTSVLPERVGRRVIGLLLIAAALAGAWFGLVKPATRRAAKDAVRDSPGAVVYVTSADPVGGLPGATIVATTTTTAPVVATTTTLAEQGTGADGSIDPGPAETGTTEPATTTTVAAPPVTIAPVAPAATPTVEGTLFSQRLEVDVDPKAGDHKDLQIPAGQELRLTDLIIQNINRDTGIVTVLKNDAVIAKWDLSHVLDNNDPLQFVSPIVFEAGSTLVFQLDCDAPGISGQCSEGLLVSGRLVTV